jgi:penicillin-binding protein 1B
MQLARILWLAPDKNWKRKAEELLITMHLEHKLTKQQIFEYYANQVYLGRLGTFSINGFGEAARAYFGKDISQLNVPEAAMLAGMVQRPSYYNPFRYPERVQERRNRVLNLMRENKLLTDRGVPRRGRCANPGASGRHGSAQFAVLSGLGQR